MQYTEDSVREEVVYDQQEPSSGGGYYHQKDPGYYSQWGPKRPQHIMTYPKRQSKKYPTFRSCVCHPLSIACTIFLVLLAILVFIGTMIILSYYAKGYFSSLNDHNVNYGPGDTQELFFSSLFCEELSINKDTLYSNRFFESTLYLLREPPTLSGEVQVSFEDLFKIYDKVHQRNFHLFPESVISVEVCVDNRTHDGVGSFYLVKGRSTYEEWLDGGEKENPPSIATLHIWDFCEDKPDNSLNYTVIEEDQYYLVFINDRHITPYVSEINASYTILRKIYEYTESSIVNSCSFTTSPCSLRMPFQRVTSALLAYGEPLNWEDNWTNNAISIDCVPRVWFYTFLIALWFLVMAASTFWGCVICFYCSRFLLSEDESQAPLLNRHTGMLYSNSPPIKEMDNPSKNEQNRNECNKASCRYVTPVSAPNNQTAANMPHPSLSFKKSYGSSYTMGVPTFETFTRR